MKFPAVFTWRCIVVILWLLSLQDILRAGFQPCCFGAASVERAYPWVPITLLSLVITFECLLLYFIWQPPKSMWSPLRIGGMFGLFLLFSIPAVIILLTTDLPAHFYVTSEFTLLLTLIFLHSLAFAVIVSLGKKLFKGWHMTVNK